MLSVIVPVYNVEKYLKQCVNSIIDQSYKDLEIILVDDGSSDSSGEICNEFLNIDKRIKVIHKENGGQTSAYIMGIKESRGDLISFIDSDDWIDLQMYEKMVPYFEDIDINLVICRYDRVYADRSEIAYADSPAGIYECDKRLKFFDSPTQPADISLSRCNKIYRRADVEKVLPYLNEEIRFIEDNLFNLIFATKFFKKAFKVDEVLYHYRYNDNSTSSTFSENKIADMNRVYEKLVASDDSGEYIRPINGQFIVASFIAMSATIKGGGTRREKIRMLKKIMTLPNLKKAMSNCDWKCKTFSQRIKKFLIKRKMALLYYSAYKMFKL